MRAFIAIAISFFAAAALAQDGAAVRVDRFGTSRIDPPPWRERPRVVASFRDGEIAIAIDPWTEACTGSSAAPTFSTAREGRVIYVDREGAAAERRCDDRLHSDSFCAGPDGEMMDCPRPICVCAFRVTATVRPRERGRHRVLVRDGSRIVAARAVWVP